jgi:hypothetical protein
MMTDWGSVEERQCETGDDVQVMNKVGAITQCFES